MRPTLFKNFTPNIVGRLFTLQKKGADCVIVLDYIKAVNAPLTAAVLQRMPFDIAAFFAVVMLASGASAVCFTPLRSWMAATSLVRSSV